MERTILPRETRTLPTPWGEVQVKVCTLNGKEQLYPCLLYTSNMINTAIAAKPAGLGLAACDTSSVLDALQECVDKGIRSFWSPQGLYHRCVNRNVERISFLYGA